MKNNIYHEYYPGKKQLKFKGGQDKNSLRHGIWEFYDPTGLTLSSTHYEHGKKDGISLGSWKGDFVSKQIVQIVWELV